MKNLVKCTVCGYICEEEKLGDKCPKCGAPREKFEVLNEDATKKIFSSDRTNDIHMEIVALASKIVALAEEGIEINLDPGCMRVFNVAKDSAWEIKQLAKAEIAGHVNKEKW